MNMTPGSTATGDNLDKLNARINSLSEVFEKELQTFVHENGMEGVANLHDAIAYALGTDTNDPAVRGKRIRPVLCLLTAQAMGADLNLAIPFALSIELMHNFALVHDDMEDGDIMRRGRDAVWIKYGVPHAINIGDFLLVCTNRALTHWGSPQLTAQVRFRLLGLITSALDHTHIGQALEINARGHRPITEGEYLRIVREKTGYYLAAPIQGGAIVAGADQATIDTIAEMALLLGPLFQIVDDIIDLTDGKGRESIGSDIREGKRSYLVAHASEHASDQDRDRLFDILDKPRQETTDEEIREVAVLFEKYGSIEAGRHYCQKLYEQSQNQLKRLPKSLADELGPFLEMLVNRSH